MSTEQLKLNLNSSFNSFRATEKKNCKEILSLLIQWEQALPLIALVWIENNKSNK